MDSEINYKRLPNPRQNANVFSVATFCFTLPLFFKGRKKELGIEDLPETWDVHKSTNLAKKIEAAWDWEKQTAAKKNREPSLVKTLMRTHALEIGLFGLLYAFIEVVVKLAQPLALGELLDYFSAEDRPPKSNAYLYAAAIVGCSFMSVILSHPAALGVLHVGMKLRVSCTTLIYRKILQMTQNNLEEVSAGKVINLVANDVNRFDQVAPFLNSVWVGPIQSAVGTYMIYREVGIAGVLGMVAFLIFIPMQLLMGKLLAKCRLKTATLTDERVRLLNEIISGIQIIKMYAWEKPYRKIAELTRSAELDEIRKGSYIKGVFVTLVTVPNKIGLFATILVYVLSGNTISARQAFMLTAYYNMLKPTMAISFPLAIFLLAEVSVSIRRIREFLLCNSKSDTSNATPNQLLHALEVANARAKWQDKLVLTNINLTIKRGSLVAIIGQVGSGKTSILQAILKELPLCQGTMNVSGSVSYSSQQPWLFTGTVRQNILFNNTYDKVRYKAVAKNCALKPDFAMLPYSDKTVVGERGVSLSGGQKARINLARCVYNQADIYLLDDPLSAVDPHVGKQLFNDCICEFLRGKTVILITHQLQYLNGVDHIVVLENGTIKTQGNFKELQASGVDFTKVLEPLEERNDDAEFDHARRPSLDSIISVDQGLTPGILKEEKLSGTVASSVYTKFLGGARSPFLIFITVFLLVLVQLVTSVIDYFISYWTTLEQTRRSDTNLETSFWNFSTDTCVTLYYSSTIIFVALVQLRSFAFYETCINASKMLYQKMFNCIMQAKLLFFHTNPSGRILNRFSNDVGLVDEKFPTSVFLVLQMGLGLVSVLIMVAVVNPWLLVTAAVIVIIIYLIAGFYLKTSRNVKRIEGIARSPVYAHINATLQGLTTIRAFNATGVLQKEFYKHQDLHSSAWYTFISSSTAFGYWLDLTAMIYIGLVTFSFLVLESDQNGGNVGLAISQTLAITGLLQITMKEMAEVENLMTSVERIIEYTKIKGEDPLNTGHRRPPENWPEFGRLEFRKLHLSYAPGEPPVLKDLNFIIAPLEKIGVVGRTGAGKSSIIAALFRLGEIEGSVLVDEIDTRTIGLHDLRSKISIIPQEPVLFSGTLRRNLDPFNEFKEDALWNALDDVELKQVVNNLSGGLDAQIQEGGTNLSVGQRQLVCLARAIIRNNKILVLDEATANVDPQTDNLIQKTIREKFANCTVFTIAHRLNTVMDSDKILVMDCGKLLEFEHPHILLQNEQGLLYSMAHQNSKATYDMFCKIAKENYEKRLKLEIP